ERRRQETTSTSRAIGVLDLEGAAEDREEYNDQCRDQQGSSSAARVLRPLEEVNDQVPDHHSPRAPDELRRQVLAEDRDEDEDDGGRDPRSDLGQKDAPDRGRRRRAEVHRRAGLIPVETLQRGVEGQRGEREVQVDENENHSRPVVEKERDRLRGRSGPLEESIHGPLGAEDR